MKIYIDEQIPMLADILGKEEEVETFNGREIRRDDLDDAKAIFVRSTTKVDEVLLDETPVELVGSATSGIDHLDTGWLERNDIEFGDAKGSNANSVAEYVIYSMLKYSYSNRMRFNSLTIGVIGYGEVGSRVVDYANKFGLKILVNDPPKKDDNYDFPDHVKYTTKVDIFKNADIITNHVPLYTDGKYKTHSIICDDFFKQIKKKCLLIHTSRGKVVDEKDLIRYLDRRDITPVIDVWQNEPQADETIAKQCMIATPHIAGYSYEGKLRGFRDMVRLYEEYFDKKVDSSVLDEKLSEYEPMPDERFNDPWYIYNILKRSRKIDQDHKNFMEIFNKTEIERRDAFDELRKTYPERHEKL